MMFNILAVDANTEWLMMDATIIHSRLSTRRGRKRGQQMQALGRCRGWFTTKLHAVCDALGNPSSSS